MRLIDVHGVTVCEAIWHHHELPPAITNMARRLIDPDHPIAKAQGTPRFELHAVLRPIDGGPLAVYREKAPSL